MYRPKATILSIVEGALAAVARVVDGADLKESQHDQLKGGLA